MYAIIALVFCLLLGVMIRAQGITALLWMPLGFAFALFATAQIVLPIVMGLPRAIRLVAKREMRSSVIARILVTPLIWFVQLFVVGFAFGFLWPSAAESLYNNAAFNLGLWLGTFAILLSPLSKKGRADFREDFDRSYGRFYTGSSAEIGSMPKAAEEETEEHRTRGDLERLRGDLELLEDPETIFSFGRMSFDGDGTEQDYVAAANWFRIAAEQGHAKAQHNLALMYENGLGVPKDCSEAAKWYRLSAEQGLASSQNNLGVLLEAGDGVEQDHIAALEWYRRAEQGGDPNAPSNINRLSELLQRK